MANSDEIYILAYNSETKKIFLYNYRSLAYFENSCYLVRNVFEREKSQKMIFKKLNLTTISINYRSLRVK